MKLNMDSIQFENRWEIEDIINALTTYQEEHGQNETVQKMIDKLDAMYISW